MKNNSNLLNKVLNLDKWQAVQDSIAEKTHLAIVTVDYKGDTVTEHSGCNKFCKLIRDNPSLAQYCKKCDSRGGLEAVRQNKPYIYLCHFDIVDIAIPIIINNFYAGAILAGQVRLKKDHKLEKILTIPSELDKKIKHELADAYAELPLLTYDEILTSINMLNKICNYVIEESLQKNLLIDMYENVYRRDKFEGTNVSLDNAREILASGVSNHYNKPIIGSDIQSVTLRPAIEYINANYKEDIKVSTLTDVCNISAGYLSRLFVKETGYTFTEYLNRVKIMAACEMLKNTDYSIAGISDALGFSDPSYFNRVFKKIESVTPAVYRKFNK